MNVKAAAAVRTKPVWVAVFTTTALVAVFVVWTSFRSAKAMSAATASGEEMFTRAVPGAQVKLVLEIAQAPKDGAISGKLLQKEPEKTYLRTTTTVAAQSSAKTKFVMGAPAHLHAGAVVHVTGILQKDRSVDSEQIVILTGYVEVR